MVPFCSCCCHRSFDCKTLFLRLPFDSNLHPTFAILYNYCKALPCVRFNNNMCVCQREREREGGWVRETISAIVFILIALLLMVISFPLWHSNLTRCKTCTRRIYFFPRYCLLLFSRFPNSHILFQYEF